MKLLAERSQGLASYLEALLKMPAVVALPAFRAFCGLSSRGAGSSRSEQGGAKLAAAAAEDGVGGEGGHEDGVGMTGSAAGDGRPRRRSSVRSKVLAAPEVAAAAEFLRRNDGGGQSAAREEDGEPEQKANARPSRDGETPAGRKVRHRGTTKIKTGLVASTELFELSVCLEDSSRSARTSLTIRKRYSDFKKLHWQLCRDPAVTGLESGKKIAGGRPAKRSSASLWLPQLPPKMLSLSLKSYDVLLAERSEGLALYLERLVHIPAVVQSSVFRRFVGLAVTDGGSAATNVSGVKPAA